MLSKDKFIFLTQNNCVVYPHKNRMIIAYHFSIGRAGHGTGDSKTKRLEELMPEVEDLILFLRKEKIRPILHPQSDLRTRGYIEVWISGFKNITLFVWRFGNLIHPSCAKITKDEKGQRRIRARLSKQWINLLLLLSNYNPQTIMYSFSPHFKRHLFALGREACGSLKNLAFELELDPQALHSIIYKENRRISLNVLLNLVSIITKSIMVREKQSLPNLPTSPSYKEVLKNLKSIGIKHGNRSKRSFIFADQIARTFFDLPSMRDFTCKLSFNGAWKVENNTSFFDDLLPKMSGFTRFILLLDPVMFDQEVHIRILRRLLNLRRPTNTSFLHEFSLHNFKCFNDKIFHFTRGLNFVIGDSGTGKSALIEALLLPLLANKEKYEFLDVADEHFLNGLDEGVQTLVAMLGENAGNVLINDIDYTVKTFLDFSQDWQRQLKNIDDAKKWFENMHVILNFKQNQRQETAYYCDTTSTSKACQQSLYGDFSHLPFMSLYLPLIHLNSLTLRRQLFTHYKPRSRGTIDMNEGRKIGLLMLLTGFYEKISPQILPLLHRLFEHWKKKHTLSLKNLRREICRKMVHIATEQKVSFNEAYQRVLRDFEAEHHRVSSLPSIHEGKSNKRWLTLFLPTEFGLIFFWEFVPHYLRLLSRETEKETKLYNQGYYPFFLTNESDRRILDLCYFFVCSLMLSPCKLLLLDEVDVGLDQELKVKLYTLLKFMDFRQIIATSKEPILRFMDENPDTIFLYERHSHLGISP